jgi:hypothetical protein
MKRKIILWGIAVVITLLVAYYQRVTGPTYPLSETVMVAGKSIHYRFERSHDTSCNAVTALCTGDTSISGWLEWKRYKTDDEWTSVAMKYSGDTLKAELPVQPPAGKLQYRIRISTAGAITQIPVTGFIVMRFKGVVPIGILLFHIFIMFGAMLLSTRAGLEFFNPEPKIRPLAYWTIVFLIVGGAILGPLVQYYAFGAFWTGWPIGTDLTDNKTALALIGWIIAALFLRRVSKPKYLALGAAILLLLLYVIPHSLLGSELDYKTLDRNRKNDSLYIR